MRRRLTRLATRVDTYRTASKVARLHRLPVVVVRSLGSLFEQFTDLLVEGVVEIAGYVHIAQFVLHSRFDDEIRHRRALASVSFKVSIFAVLGGARGSITLEIRCGV
jgi:hypothetical protein